MKRALALSLAAVLGLPLVADEPKKAEPQPAAAPAATTTDATTTTANESPLVAAAKRSKKRRAAATGKVITNETLKESKGHVSTAHTDRPLLKVPEPAPGPEQQLANEKARAATVAKAQEEARAEEKRKAAMREKAVEAAAARAEDGLYEIDDVDPAAAEGAAAEAGQTEKPPVE